MLVNIWWDEVEIAAKDLAIPHHLPRQKLCKSINFFQDPKIVLQKINKTCVGGLRNRCEVTCQ